MTRTLLHHAARLLKIGFPVITILPLVPMLITKRGGVLLALLRYTSVYYCVDEWFILSSTCTITIRMVQNIPPKK